MTVPVVPFQKMNAGGNDFVILEARDLSKDFDGGLLARRLCDRRDGVGGDGLLVVGESGNPVITLGFWNADGSEAGLCANGTSCAARVACNEEVGVVRLGTRAGELRASVSGDVVALEMPSPRGIDLHRTLEVAGRRLSVHGIDTGCPHAVVLESENGPVDFFAVAPLLRRHDGLGPGGANVDVVQRVDASAGNLYSVRFWERGVEGETLSCGTGAVAVALVACLVEGRPSPIRITSAGGGIVTVSFRVADGLLCDVILEGVVARVFRGTFLLD